MTTAGPGNDQTREGTVQEGGELVRGVECHAAVPDHPEDLQVWEKVARLRHQLGDVMGVRPGPEI